MTSRSGESWLDEHYRESLNLAKDVFDVLCQSGTDIRSYQAGTGDRCCCQPEDCSRQIVFASQLASLVGALRDCADGAGGFVSVDSPSSSPLSRNGVPDRSACCQQLNRDEFLKAMREAFGIVGRRAFDSVLRTQLRLLTYEKQSKDGLYSDRSAGTGNSSFDMDTTRASGVPTSTPSGSDCCKTSVNLGSGRPQPPQLIHGGDWATPLAADDLPAVSGTSPGGASSAEAKMALPAITPTPSASLASAAQAERQASSDTPEPWEPIELSRQLSCPADREQAREQAREQLAQMTQLLQKFEMHPGYFAGSAPSSPLSRLGVTPSVCASGTRIRSCSAADVHRVNGELLYKSLDEPPQATEGEAEQLLTPTLSPIHGESGAYLDHFDHEEPMNRMITEGSIADTACIERQESGSASHAGSPAASLSSQSGLWKLAEESLIFFDWDDTLCPTTLIHEDPRLSWCQEAPCFADPSIPLSAPTISKIGGYGESFAPGSDGPLMLDCLKRHQEMVCSTLRSAGTCGKVVIVTLAKQGWVELSIKNFMPAVGAVFEELDIEIVYAREVLPPWKFRAAAFDQMDTYLLMKQEAFRQAIKRFYISPAVPGVRKRHRRSWKNILCIGDSETERDAMIEVLFTHTQPDKHGKEKPCRCKTIKLPEDPDLQQLTTELELLNGWMEALVHFDGDLILDVANTEDTLLTLEKILHPQRTTSQTFSISDACNSPSRQAILSEELPDDASFNGSLRK